MARFYKDAIGVFDSGIGGLFTLSNLTKAFPKNNFIYLADTANLPYGEKNKSELTLYLKNILNFFELLSINTLVLACNTLSSIILENSIHINNLNLINVITPAINMITPNDKNIGILATQYTVDSGIYRNLITNSNHNVFEIACPELVNLIESNQNISKIEPILNYYLNQFPKLLDCLILGCTHYQFLAESISNFWQNKIKIIDTNSSVLNHVFLPKNLNENSGKIEFFVSGDPNKFVKIASSIFPFDFNNVKKISL